MPRGCLQFVIVVFPDHTHLLFLNVLFLTHVFACVLVSLPHGTMGWYTFIFVAYCSHTSSVLVFGSSFVVLFFRLLYFAR